LAMVYATRTVSLTQPGAEPVERTGTATDVVRRQADGRWLIAIDNPNGVDATSPTGGADGSGH
jgi:ketosteroid isomerase-like protein